MTDQSQTRETIFISKATPGDDDFVLWLAPRLETAGYRVFADIMRLEGGDEWRGKLTAALRDDAVRMLLCCSDKTLARRGVKEEISIAESLTGKLEIPNFIIPLKLESFDAIFGVAGLQYVDFSEGWARGLTALLTTLEKQCVPKAGDGLIQPAWAQYQRRMAITVERSPEILTTNWLRVLGIPDEMSLLVPRNTCDERKLAKLTRSCALPTVPFGRGLLTFASPMELEEHFETIGPLVEDTVIDVATFIADGVEALSIKPREAKSIMNNLLRQAWESHCKSRGLFMREYSSGVSFHVDESMLGIGKRVAWGTQGQRRNSMLRNKAKGKVWEYGVSAVPSLFPFPHLKLKGRVLFSDIGEKDSTVIIADKRTQHRLRRSVCSGWRNKAWHGRIMAFMELLAGESPYIDLAVGSGGSITLDAMPIQTTSPVTAQQQFRQDEDAEETDQSTITGQIQDEDEAA